MLRIMGMVSVLALLGLGAGPAHAFSCGNNVVESGEQCDDGNLQPCDGCSPTCMFQGIPLCGDGLASTSCGEQCDDGNTNNNDACSNTCMLTAAHVPATPLEARFALGALLLGGGCYAGRRVLRTQQRRAAH